MSDTVSSPERRYLHQSVATRSVVTKLRDRKLTCQTKWIAPTSGIVPVKSLGTTILLSAYQHRHHNIPNSAGVPYSAGIVGWHTPAPQADHHSLLYRQLASAIKYLHNLPVKSRLVYAISRSSVFLRCERVGWQNSMQVGEQWEC